jgi:predicted component of type VI protein secretion system
MNCDIKIDDKLLSKTQAGIKYIDGHWVLTDGHNGKVSTNGTWIYLNEDYQIFDSMVFKANQTIFAARII